MLNPFVEKYHDKLARLYRSYSWLGMSPEEIAVMEFIEESMTKPKRPPLKYDSRQPGNNIKFPWGLYYKGDFIHHVIAYDIDNRFYVWNDGLSNHTVRNVSFCVKRLG